MTRMREVACHAELVLPDGRTIDYAIQTSAKARSLRLKLSAREGLVVVAPQNLDRQRLAALVAGKAEWIAERLTGFDAVRHLIGKGPVARPQAFDLPALAESWRVEYKPTRSRTVGARTDQPGRIVVAGTVDDVDACHAALRRWLARHATSALSPWLANLAEPAGLRYADLAIKNQRTRWGSCATSGRISLNCKLLFLPRELVCYVMTHELCHLLEANHSERFWGHLRQFEPAADLLHGRMRDAWRFVPTWAQRGDGTML
ncbi:MAG: M48 family metallopeptidase [Dechloromonas sp.]|jgi:predicted metal-dependent hydrolase|nr:M48 family metallopeptidase [Candidatus Dechloromonas phosphoritropha]MBP8786100.1 M48 family metallopeptidase [Azonexus sp.]